MNYFEKLGEYYKSDKARKDNDRFVKQVKGTFISSAVIIGVVFFLIIVLLVITGIQSLFN